MDILQMLNIKTNAQTEAEKYVRETGREREIEKDN